MSFHRLRNNEAGPSPGKGNKNLQKFLSQNDNDEKSTKTPPKENSKNRDIERHQARNSRRDVRFMLKIFRKG